MKNIVLILLSGLLVFGCRHKESEKEFAGEYIGAGFRTYPEIASGQIIKHTKYVALETDSLCFIQEPQQVKFVNDTLFILDKENLFTFTGEGKFVAKIGNKGRSPVDYIHLASFFVDSKNSCVAILDDVNGRILKYTFKGEYIGSAGVKKDVLRFATQMEFLAREDAVLCSYALPFKPMSVPNCLSVVSLKDYSVADSIPYGIGPVGRSLVHFSSHPIALSQGGDSTALCAVPFSDEMMEYDGRGFVVKYVVKTIEPVVDMQRVQALASSFHDYFDIFDNIRDDKRSAGIRNIFESEGYIVLSIGGEKGTYSALYDKKNKKGAFYLNYYSDVTNSYYDVLLGLSGSSSVWKDCFISVISQPVGETRSTCIRQSCDKDFIAVLNATSEEDNPIIAFMELKDSIAF